MNFQPNWASMPGNTIADFLYEKKIAIGVLASQMITTPEYLENIINGNIVINNDIAEKLSRNLGGSLDFWLKREEEYREAVVRLKITDEQLWLKELPIRDMIKFGWIGNVNNLLTACLKYFDVPDVKTWRQKYTDLLLGTTFRTSPVLKADKASTATWLRKGEIVASEISCDKWDVDAFEETLIKIRTLTKKKAPKDFLPELIALCSKCGVAVVIARTPAGCRASGATKFINKDKALLMLSFRYLSDDQFWFTFFHEAGHLVLHNSNSTFIEAGNGDRNYSEEETEANIFSGEILIPYEMQNELAKLTSNKRSIISFAMKLGISPGIVVGQMQHHGYIDHQYLNSYKRRYDWEDIL